MGGRDPASYPPVSFTGILPRMLPARGFGIFFSVFFISNDGSFKGTNRWKQKRHKKGRNKIIKVVSAHQNMKNEFSTG